MTSEDGRELRSFRFKDEDERYSILSFMLFFFLSFFIDLFLLYSHLVKSMDFHFPILEFNLHYFSFFG